MADKNFTHKQVIVNGAMSGTSTISSQISNIRGMDNVFYDIQVTGSPVGTFAVQVSSSYDPITNPSAIFIPLNLSPSPVVTGGAKQIGIDLNQMGAQWIQLTYTNTSGSGVVNAFLSAKAI